MVTMNVQVDPAQVIEAMAEITFSENEKMQVLQALFPQRGYTSRDRLLATVSEFVINHG